MVGLVLDLGKVNAHIQYKFNIRFYKGICTEIITVVGLVLDLGKVNAHIQYTFNIRF